MSFFQRIFGRVSAAEERAAADVHFEAGRWFEARQAYERAIEKSTGDAAHRAHCSARIAACFDGLSERCLSEAERFRRDGELELARTELATAAELARTPSVREKARRALEMLERRDAVVQATDTPELEDDERWAVIAGTWEDAQTEEYDAYGEGFRGALLALHDAQPGDAGAFLEGLVAAHEDRAVYLWLEVGRARLAGGDEAGAGKALRRFLKRVADDDRSDARLNAHVFLASLAEKAGDEEKAISWLQKALTGMPDDPRPYLQLGVYLRQKGHAAEAVEILRTSIELMDEDRPSWEAHQELGLALRDTGEIEAAIELLEKVIRHFTQRSSLDFPPSTALPLARLHEEAGRLERAADLYRSLANGSDRERHLEHHRDAARVLVELGLLSEARRMLTRAAALAESKPDQLATIEAEIVALDAQL